MSAEIPRLSCIRERDQVLYVETASGEIQAEQVLGALEENQSPRKTSETLALTPAALVEAVAACGLGPEGSTGPSLTQTKPVRSGLGRALEEPALAELLPSTSQRSRLALAAGLLQIHDFWDTSHDAAQEADDQGEHFASEFWHGIAHRREPDAGNAAYWFRRVGRHPLLRTLGRAVRSVFDDETQQYATSRRLLHGGTWDPNAFIDFCISARPDTSDGDLGRRLQRLEMLILLQATLNQALGE